MIKGFMKMHGLDPNTLKVLTVTASAKASIMLGSQAKSIATEELGNRLMVANSQINSLLAWASLVAVSVLGIPLFAAVVLAERIFMPWAEEDQHG